MNAGFLMIFSQCCVREFKFLLPQIHYNLEGISNLLLTEKCEVIMQPLIFSLNSNLSFLFSAIITYASPKGVSKLRYQQKLKQ